MFQYHAYLVRTAFCRLIVFNFIPLLHAAAYSNITNTIDREYESAVPRNAGEYILPPHPKINLTIAKPIEIPISFNLYQNYPNPFNPTTTIEFDLPKDCQVEITTYNIMGHNEVTLKYSKFVSN